MTVDWLDVTHPLSVWLQGTSHGSGAGYGSEGGHATGTSSDVRGGPAYGSTRLVSGPGSGGGGSALGRGGQGGGLLNLTINRLLLLDGECWGGW